MMRQPELSVRDLSPPGLSQRFMISANDYAVAALRFMRTRNLPALYVLDREQVVGVIHAADLEGTSDTVLADRDVREYMRPDFGATGASCVTGTAGLPVGRGRAAKTRRYETPAQSARRRSLAQAAFTAG